MQTITVGTFNMSFAGDLGLNPRRADARESEAAFHLSNPAFSAGPDVKSRNFWINATKFVEQFLALPNFGALGLQEMNMTTTNESGTGHIEYIVSKYSDIRCKAEEIVAGSVKTSLMILWNSKLMGELNKSYSADLTYKHTEVPKPDGTLVTQSGRPIVMVLTTNGYLLINVHGPNVPDASKATMKDFKDAIQQHVSNFMGDTPIKNGKIFLMGDLNDRYDAIQLIELTFGGAKHNLTYNGKAPYSCCHNWDSSCSGTELEPVYPIGRPVEGNPIGTCKVPKDEAGNPYTLAGLGTRYLMNGEGNLANYRYMGDKVFGEIPASDIRLFIQEPERIASKESDHEPVAAEFKTPSVMIGGRRRVRKTLRRRNKNRKIRKSRKH
jgi:hypothetical protein